MNVPLAPLFQVSYDPVADRVLVVFGDGAAIELDPEEVPALINGLMESRRQAKAASQAKAPPPPPPPPPPTAPPPPRARAHAPARGTALGPMPRAAGVAIRETSVADRIRIRRAR